MLPVGTSGRRFAPLGVALGRLGLGYPLLLAVAIAITLVVRPVDEAALPDVAARPRVDIRGVADLDLGAREGMPRIRAARATPLDAGGPLTIAGAIAGVALEDLVLDLPTPGDEPAALCAAYGELSDDVLSLTRVVLRAQGAVLASAGAARVTDGAITFPGLVVFRPGPTQDVEREVTLSFAEFVRRAGRR